MRYFFDVRDGESLAQDEFGVEHASPEDALQEAARAATGIAEDVLVVRGGGTLEIHVREGTRPVGVVTVSLEIRPGKTG